MKKFYKMMIFALVFAATMTTAILSPMSFRAADAMVFAETAASATVGATITVKAMPTSAVVGQALDLPVGSTGEAGAVVVAKVTNSAGRVVASHSTADDADETFAFTPSVAGDYNVVYTATKDGVATTTSEKFTIKVTQSSAEMEFAANSAYIIPAKIGKTDKVVLPVPTVTEKEEVDDLSGLTVTAQTKTGVDVALSTIAIDGVNHYVFAPAKDASENVITGEYTIKYKYKANGYYATKTFKVEVVDGYQAPTNLSYTLASAFPTSAVLGNKLTLPRPSVVDKDKNNASVDVYTVVEVKFGNVAVDVDMKDLSFKPMNKATGADKYTITYKMYDLKALDLANEANAGKTLAEALEGKQPVLTGEYTLTNVEDTEKPTVKVAKDYVVTTTDETKSVAEDLAKELEDNDYSYLLPSVVRVGQAGVTIPAAYGYDNYSSYNGLYAKLKRTVKYNGNSYVLEDDVRENEYLTYTKTEANQTASVTFLKEGKYEIVYRVEDEAGKYVQKSYAVDVKATTYTDDVAPYITLPTDISKSAKAGETIKFSAPTVVDYELDHAANPTSTTVVDAHPETKVYYYLGSWTAAMGQTDLEAAIAGNLAGELQLVDGKYEYEIPTTATKLSIVIRANDHARYLVGGQDNVAFAAKEVNIYSTNDANAPTITTDLALTQQDLELQGAAVTNANREILVPNVEFADPEGNLSKSIIVVDANGTQLAVGKKNGQYTFTAVAAGTYQVTVMATDRGGNSVFATVMFEVADTSVLYLQASTALESGVVSMTLGNSYEIALPTLKNADVTTDFETISAVDFAASTGAAVVAVDFDSYDQPGDFDFNETTWEFTPKAVGTYTFAFLAKGANGIDAEQSRLTYQIEVTKSNQKPVIYLNEDVDVPTYSPYKDAADELVLIKLPAYNVESANGINQPGKPKVTGPNSENVTVYAYDSNDVEIAETDLVTEVAYYGFKATDGVGLYTVTYTATDKEGLEATETLQIKVGDTTAPTAEGYANPEGKTWTVGDELSVDLTKINISDLDDTDAAAKTAKGNVAINNTTGIRLSITLTGPNGTVSTSSTEDSIYVYKLDAAGDYTLTYVIKDAAGNETQQVYNFTVKAVENNTVSAEKAWGIALIILSVAILAGVIIYFVRTKDADATNLPSKKDDKKDNK